MKKSGWAILVFIGLILALFLFNIEGVAGEKIYRMKGEITAIEPAYNTVVIEVPVQGRLFTVAGPLSSEAILRKSGRPATLTDFVIGDQVTVKWRATDKGHIIEMLEAR